jgi:hypothetical protein
MDCFLKIPNKLIKNKYFEKNFGAHEKDIVILFKAMRKIVG